MSKRYQYKNSEYYLTPAQLSQLIRSQKSIRNRLALALLAFTGIRRCELCYLNVEDIDLKCNKINIQRGKGNKHRVVFFPENMKKYILEHIGNRKKGPLFLARNGGYLTLKTINNIVSKAGTQAGIKNPNPRYKNLNPHLFRHSIARNWKRERGSMESLQKILGHESIRTTLDLYGTESMEETGRNYRLMANKLVDEEEKED